MTKDTSYSAISNQIVKFIRTEVKKRKSKGVIIGMSGGIDSSVVSMLATIALGNQKVFGLILPDSSVTPEYDTKDAINLAKHLKIGYKVVELKNIKKLLIKNLPKDKMAGANLLVRLRMCLLYYYSTVLDSLVLGTGNKSEIMLGYYTKYGDGGVDLFPIADLYKTQVRSLANYLQIPNKIIEKKSSAHLWKGHTAEGEIGIKYEEIDRILKFLDSKKEYNNSSLTDIGIKKNNLYKVKKMIDKNMHKKFTPPVCYIHGD